MESRGRRKDAIQLTTHDDNNDDNNNNNSNSNNSDSNMDDSKKIEKQSSNETTDHLSNLGKLQFNSKVDGSLLNTG